MCNVANDDTHTQQPPGMMLAFARATSNSHSLRGQSLIMCPICLHLKHLTVDGSRSVLAFELAGSANAPAARNKFELLLTVRLQHLKTECTCGIVALPLHPFWRRGHPVCSRGVFPVLLRKHRKHTTISRLCCKTLTKVGFTRS